MSSLIEHLDRLEIWLRRDHDAPPWTGVLLIESAHIKYGPIDEVPKHALCSIEAFEPKFRQLCEAGYAWINLSALGVLGEHLVVCVERPPRGPTGVPPGRTSINLSGPQGRVRGNRLWDLSVCTRLID